MKKLKLNLDDLAVESFETTPEIEEGRGTVHGYISPGPGNTCDVGCTDSTCGATCGNTCGTCANTCPNTCANTCPNTCNNHTCWASCNGGCGLTSPPGCNTNFLCTRFC